MHVYTYIYIYIYILCICVSKTKYVVIICVCLVCACFSPARLAAPRRCRTSAGRPPRCPAPCLGCDISYHSGLCHTIA